MRAVAQAHLRTGAPIAVHTDAVARTGLVAQEVLRSEGVDPAQSSSGTAATPPIWTGRPRRSPSRWAQSDSGDTSLMVSVRPATEATTVARAARCLVATTGPEGPVPRPR
ncbi:phosphotriesterase family protein [Streptomyces sp. NPDC003343]